MSQSSGFVIMPTVAYEVKATTPNIRLGPALPDDAGYAVFELDKMVLTAEILPNPLSDAQRLAIAVLRGDQEAALILADEVQMCYKLNPNGSPRFIPRKELEDRMHYAEVYMNRVKDLEGIRSGSVG